MSWYQSTYVGIQDKSGKIYPWGAYDKNGRLHPIYVNSRSFITDIGDYFHPITEENLSEELIKEFPYDSGKHPDSMQEGISQYFEYLPAEEIPSGSYIKRGYCLLTDINAYLNDAEYFDGFYDVLSPEEYAFKLENELKFGEPKPQKDEFGEEYVVPSCSKYAYFTWVDHNCKEYDAWLMRNMIDTLEDYDIKKDYKYVIIKTEG